MVTMFNQVNGRPDAMNGRIDALNERMDRMQDENNGRFDEMQGEMNRRFDQIFEVLRVFEGRITRLEEKAGISTTVVIYYGGLRTTDPDSLKGENPAGTLRRKTAGRHLRAGRRGPNPISANLFAKADAGQVVGVSLDTPFAKLRATRDEGIGSLSSHPSKPS